MTKEHAKEISKKAFSVTWRSIVLTIVALPVGVITTVVSLTFFISSILMKFVTRLGLKMTLHGMTWTMKNAAKDDVIAIDVFKDLTKKDFFDLELNMAMRKYIDWLFPSGKDEP